MNKESVFLKIINGVLEDSSYLGDDCAYLKELNLLVSSDTLVENVHFKLDYFTPYELGKKACLVNVSDILAGGGKPEYLTVSLSGKLDEAFIKDFYSGVNEVCRGFKIKVIGGDLVGGDKISVTITILGNTKGRRISSRKNAKAGYSVYLKGFHGSSAQGLELLLKGTKDKNNEFVKAHLEPVLYPLVSETISKETGFDYAMMDTSDGLYDALYKISKESNTGFKINYNKVEKKVKDKNLVLFGGEDFGLLICLHPDDCKIAEKLNLNKIGEVTDGNKILIDGAEIKDDKSFRHFI